MSRKRLVLFVEGEGESAAAPILVRRLLTVQDAWDAVFLDENTFRVGNVAKLLKDNCREWKRKLRACLKRPNVGGILLLLDGDLKSTEFCTAEVARRFAKESIAVGLEQLSPWRSCLRDRNMSPG